MSRARLSIVLVSYLLIVPTLQFPAEPPEEEYKACTSPPTFISNGHVIISDDGWNAQYSCRDDFVLIGPTEVTCVDSSWSPNPPYCLGTGCPLLSAIDHGTMLYQYGGAIAEVKCEEGYVLQGPQVLTCKDHQWNSTMPECVKIGDGAEGQGELTSDSDDDVTQVARQHASSLAKADYSCISPEQHVPPPIVAHAVAIPQWSLVDGTPRLFATYRCRWHHVLHGSGSNVYCQHGVWVGDLPQCVPLVDRTMDEVRQVTIDDISSLTHEQAVEVADYSCVDGTKMVDPPHNTNAYVTLQVYIAGGLPHLYGEVTCRTGTLMGSKYVYCVQGRWLGSITKCV